MTSSTTS